MWIISPCGLHDQSLNYMLQQFKFKTCLKLWVFSHSDPCKLQTTLLPSYSPSSKIRNAPPISRATSFLTQPWLCQKQVNPFLSALSWQLQCHHYPAVDTTFLGCRCFQHLRTVLALFLDQSCHCCCCVCCTYIFVVWTSPSSCNLNSCRDVQRSYEHNLWQFLLQVQTGQSCTFLTLFVQNDF